MEPDRIAQMLYDTGAISFGDFTLSSGKKSPYYVDMRAIPGSPVAFRRVIQALLDGLGDLDSFDTLASIPTGGLVYTSALALECVKPLAYVRTSVKEHGTSRKIEGNIASGDRVLIVDDVATTGESILHAVGPLREMGAKVTDALVIVDRLEGAGKTLEESGITLRSVANISDIASSLHKHGKIDDSMLNAIRT